MSKQDGRAEDGSTNPQKRSLSAWERDLLCRVIYTAMQLQDTTGLTLFVKTHDEVDGLIEIYDAISPRDD